MAISVPLAIALALWLPDAARAQAQRPDRASEPVMVTGTRLPATLRQSTDSLTIITREQIDTLAAASGPDLLRQVAHVEIDQRRRDLTAVFPDIRHDYCINLGST